ncbi:MAG TPA: DNA-formamidopyrimidine glycosylase family protein [Candidatus Sulfotelmatobacter sp.]|nr:DNA-formamidopyrimidine glycosylase family protein [Candidatus Sulfotelmatobacter sp.]
MSIELPEAYILAKQMNKELPRKEIIDFKLQNHEKLQKLGFINKDSSIFNELRGSTIETVISRGNVICLKLNHGMNLILAPEYGGIILYSPEKSDVPAKFHLSLAFTDNSHLSVVLTGMGVIQAFKDENLEKSYVYRRDFSETISPIDDARFTLENFSKELIDRTVNIKTVLVGKDAILVGLSNNIFQDILYRAMIHPKKKASDLDEERRSMLYNVIKSVVQERIKLGGKFQCMDLYGNQGSYIPAMGSNMKDKICTICGTGIEKISLGGGQIYFCPKCQR